MIRMRHNCSSLSVDSLLECLGSIVRSSVFLQLGSLSLTCCAVQRLQIPKSDAFIRLQGTVCSCAITTVDLPKLKYSDFANGTLTPTDNDRPFSISDIKYLLLSSPLAFYFCLT
jgi:hypothetical protein